jgi:Lipocalin-like domain
MKIKTLHLTLLLLTTFVMACNNKKDERLPLLVGKWYIQKAERDGDPFNSLEGTVYEFTADSKMITNVPQIGSGTFELKNTALTQKSNNNITNYTVETLTQDRLVLNTIIRDLQFRFEFGRDSLILE